MNSVASIFSWEEKNIEVEEKHILYDHTVWVVDNQNYQKENSNTTQVWVNVVLENTSKQKRVKLIRLGVKKNIVKNQNVLQENPTYQNRSLVDVVLVCVNKIVNLVQNVNFVNNLVTN